MGAPKERELNNMNVRASDRGELLFFVWKQNVLFCCHCASDAIQYDENAQLAIVCPDRKYACDCVVLLFVETSRTHAANVHCTLKRHDAKVIPLYVIRDQWPLLNLSTFCTHNNWNYTVHEARIWTGLILPIIICCKYMYLVLALLSMYSEKTK